MRSVWTYTLGFILFLPLTLTPAAAENENPEKKSYGGCELFIMKSLDYVRAHLKDAAEKFDRKLSVVAPWQFAPAEENAIAKIFADADLSDEQRFERAYKLLIETRIKQFNPVSRFFVRGAVRDSLQQNSIYSKTIGALLLKYLGPHYNPIFNRTATYVRPSSGITPLDSIMAVHETEHLLHRNTNPIFWMAAIKVATIETLSVVLRTPLLVPLRRRQEVRAIGAQWELARLIPAETRVRLLRDWRYEKSHISHVERLWIRALIKSGILRRLVEIMSRGLGIEGTGFGGNTARLALEESLIVKIVGNQNLSNWYGPFLARARDRLSPNELRYIEGIWKQGSTYEPLRSEMAEYYGSHSEAEILADDGLNQEQVRRLQTMVSDLRYGDKFSDVVDEIYGATLQYAGLPKDQFIERLSVIQGYTLENIYYQHYATPFRVYMLMASYGTLLTAMVGAIPYESIPSPDIHAMVSYLMYLLGP